MKEKTNYFVFMIPAKRLDFIGKFVHRKSAQKRANKWYYDFVLLDETELVNLYSSIGRSVHIASKY
jgi:hypothetical protein